MVQQAIQDGIGDGGFTDDGMPVFDRALAGDDSGIFLIAVLDDFEQIVTLRIIEWSQKQIIEDKQLDLGQAGEHFEMGAVGFGLKEHFEQTRSAQIEYGVTVARNEVAERAGDVTFADARGPSSDGRIGKDDVRILSRANFERRIEELKQDSEGQEQDALIRGIYVLRQFCVVERKTNVVLVSEATLQQNTKIRALLYRLLDYRIIHSAGTALTHKSQPGTYHAFAIDIGCYAHMRVLEDKFTEIDLADPEAKEKMRSAPILDEKDFETIWESVPTDPELALKNQETLS